MIRWSRFQFELALAQYARDKLNGQFRRALRRAHIDKATPDEIRNLKEGYWMDLEVAHDEILRLLTERLRFLTERYFVPLPPTSDDSAWDESRIYGKVLSRSAIRQLRSEIRKEQRDDAALTIQWISLGTGLIGTATGFAAVLLNSN